MTNELKKQSKQNEVKKKDTKSTNLVATNEINEDLVDFAGVATLLGISVQRARAKIVELNIPPFSKVEVSKGNFKYLFKKSIIMGVLESQQQQRAVMKLDTKTDKMNNQYSFDELKIAFGKSLENQSSKEIGNLGLQLIAIAMNKQSEAFAKENEEKDELLKQLEAKNQELQAYQNENKYIQETRHKIDVLKAKITKAVRTKAYQNHWTYKETYVRYYKIYDEAHNFPYKEDLCKILQNI